MSQKFFKTPYKLSKLSYLPPDYPLVLFLKSHFARQKWNYRVLLFNLFTTKGRVRLSKRINFRKNSKGVWKKSYKKVQNLRHKFLDWKWPLSPSPLEVFRKFIRFGSHEFKHVTNAENELKWQNTDKNQNWFLSKDCSTRGSHGTTRESYLSNQYHNKKGQID